MKELLETLIKSQRDRLTVYLKSSNSQYSLKETMPNAYHESYHKEILGKISELELCLSQSINLYNQIKNDSESTTTK